VLLSVQLAHPDVARVDRGEGSSQCASRNDSDCGELFGDGEPELVGYLFYAVGLDLSQVCGAL